MKFKKYLPSFVEVHTPKRENKDFVNSIKANHLLYIIAQI